MKWIYALLFVSIGLNIYQQLELNQYNDEDEIYSSFDADLPDDRIESKLLSAKPVVAPEQKEFGGKSQLLKKDEIQTKSSAIKKNQPQNSAASDQNEQPLSQSSTQLYASWKKKTNKFFEQDLRLSFSQIEEYYELKEARRKEFDRFITSKMEEFYQHNSKDTPYLLTSEDTILLGKLNAKYRNKLLLNFGEEALKSYESFRDKMNQQAIKENQGFFVEF